MNKIACIFFVGLMSLMSFAAPTVTDVVAKQRYPWGLVDITCKVEGIDEAKGDWCFVLSAVFPDSGNTRRMSQFWVMRDGIKSRNLAVVTNGNYRLLWDAKGDLGEVRYTNMVVRVIVDRAGVQLWEGGPYWATTNIGAEKPEDTGYYFWWGDTVGYKRENGKWVASDGSNSNFSFSTGNAPTYGKSISTLKNEGWITSDGVLAPTHDAAHVQWGNGWRMPTKDELSALNSNCDWTWTTQNGVNGYVVKGRGAYVSKSIFLPAAGYGLGTSLYRSGSNGDYWSSVPNSDSDYAWYLSFNSSYHDTYGYYDRYYGESVRPVLGFTK